MRLRGFPLLRVWIMMRMARDLQRGDVIRLAVTIKGSDIRVVDRVVPTGYRGIVGNRPIVAVWYQDHADDQGCPTGNTWADTSLVELAPMSSRCYCPSDCNCHHADIGRTNYCGCVNH
jgi:hypothetical protein